MKQSFLKQELTNRLSLRDGKCKLGSSTEVILCESNEEAISQFLEDPTIFLLYQEAQASGNQLPKLRLIAYKLIPKPTNLEQLELALKVRNLAVQGCTVDVEEVVLSCLTDDTEPAKTKQLEQLECFTNEINLFKELKGIYTKLGSAFESSSEADALNAVTEDSLELTIVFHTLPFHEHEKIQSARALGDS